jgi:hypothetical protein
MMDAGGVKGRKSGDKKQTKNPQSAGYSQGYGGFNDDDDYDNQKPGNFNKVQNVGGLGGSGNKKDRRRLDDDNDRGVPNLGLPNQQRSGSQN